ncbi:MAG: M67 family metallopeptidase [Chloroflexi bacterium]|nr:M67 family metallopeptidase [Chloroflexota bacterium]
MNLPAAVAAAIIEHARALHPRECCGLLAGRNGQVLRRYPITNMDQTNVFYLMEPREQYQALREIDDTGWDLIGIYHSHPASEAYPSRTDITHACYEDTTEAIYPDTWYVICSLADWAAPVIRAFLIRDAMVSESDVIIDG